MMTEKGTLPVGVEFEGKVHQDFELRSQFVRDTVDIFDDPVAGDRAERNNQFFAASLFAGRLVKLGEIPKEQITVDMVLDLEQEDYMEIVQAGKRLEERMATFRGKTPAVAPEGTGDAQGGV